MTCMVYQDFSAVPIVQQTFDTTLPLGVQTFNTALTFADRLSNFVLEPVSIDITYDDVDAGPGPRRPERPQFPEQDLKFRDPGDPNAPPEFDPTQLALMDAPEPPAGPPQLDYIPRPTPLGVLPPSPAPAIPDRDLPLEPGYVMPELPVLEDIIVPEPPALSIPDFDEEPPVVDTLPEILETWNFSPEAYTSVLLDKVKATISQHLDGGTGLPAAIQDALWARARDRVTVEEGRLVQQATDEYAAKGFTEPSGILTRRIEAARHAALAQRVGLNRDLMIEEAKFEIDNLRFMIQQGIAMEGMLSGLHMQYQQLLLQGAQFLMDAAIRVFDAKVAQIRLAFDVFMAKAQVFKTMVEAELAKAEIYKAEVEAARIKGEINEQLVRRYEAQIRAVNALAEFYNARVRAFTAQVGADTARVEAFRAEVQAYGETVRAKSAEWDGYRASVEAENAKAGLYDTSVRAYAARVGVVNERNRVMLERERLAIQQHEALLRTHTATLENIRTGLATEQARIQSVASAFDAQARVFAADAQVEGAVSAAHDRRYGLNLQKAMNAATVAQQNAQMKVQENVQLTALELQALQAATQALTQISAGALSAVNTSASISFGQSTSTGCSNNYQY